MNYSILSKICIKQKCEIIIYFRIHSFPQRLIDFMGYKEKTKIIPYKIQIS